MRVQLRRNPRAGLGRQRGCGRAPRSHRPSAPGPAPGPRPPGGGGEAESGSEPSGKAPALAAGEASALALAAGEVFAPEWRRFAERWERCHGSSAGCCQAAGARWRCFLQRESCT